jgi:hypothetical protein
VQFARETGVDHTPSSMPLIISSSLPICGISCHQARALQQVAGGSWLPELIGAA